MSVPEAYQTVFVWLKCLCRWLGLFGQMKAGKADAAVLVRTGRQL